MLTALLARLALSAALLLTGLLTALLLLTGLLAALLRVTLLRVALLLLVAPRIVLLLVRREGSPMISWVCRYIAVPGPPDNPQKRPRFRIWARRLYATD